MIDVVLIASGEEYQTSASWAAATYATMLNGVGEVRVLVPANETLTSILIHNADRYNYTVDSFELTLISARKYTCQLKCHAFVYAIRTLHNNAHALIVDADTVCIGRLAFDSRICSSIARGNIAMVPDVRDRHPTRARSPWYVKPDNRLPYVNSGVILAGSNSLDMFERFLCLSKEEKFLRGPFNDQKVINYSLNTDFPNRLMVLDSIFNGMRAYRGPETRILHYAGGAGQLGVLGSKRCAEHFRACVSVIGDV